MVLFSDANTVCLSLCPVCVSRLPVQLVSGNSFETPTEAEQSRAARVAIERCVSYKNNHRAGRTEAEEEKRRAQTSP